MTWSQYAEAGYVAAKSYLLTHPTPITFFTQITPCIMTWSQYAEAGYVAAKSYLSSWLYPKSRSEKPEKAGEEGAATPEGLAAYKPDFTRCVDHFAIHAGTFCFCWGSAQAFSVLRL